MGFFKFFTSNSKGAVVATLAEGVVQWWGAINRTRFKSLFTTPRYRELHCYYVESTQIDLLMLFGVYARIIRI